ncbi:MAG: FMN-binding glutamate synthase family protein [Acidobacteriota bacterium]
MTRRVFFLVSVGAAVVILAGGFFWRPALWGMVFLIPYVGVGIHDLLQRSHSLLRIYPVVGHIRYLFEEFRPEIQQYFVESNIDGTPFSREFRSVIYQRSKGARDTMPFGTQRDVNRIGYEWMTHSLAPKPAPDEPPRIRVGGTGCRQPYLASYLNISAMSFGALGKNAIRALNRGARMGGFAHNTGEGGLSPYHLAEGGDLIWQVGTGYFGCRTLEGDFDAGMFESRAAHPSVKMIEIKLSQGAKPGHGGILPAAKVTQEIAKIRGVHAGRDVISPPAHSAFTTPAGLLEFVQRLRELSGGKPVGFKLCIGYHREFLGICKAMLATGILPDFITVDGAEGGTGAAPVELSNSVGMPMRDGLLFVNSALRGIGLRDSIRVIVAGKVVTGFHMIRALALGANMCNAARAMMFALGCIQARKCNTNTCPVGVATQDPLRNSGVVVADKAERVARYHHDTMRSFVELMASTGCESPEDVTPHEVLRRVDATTIRRFDEIYEYLPEGGLLETHGFPPRWAGHWERASTDHF